MSGSLGDEKEIARNRRTLFLLLGGVASLLLPLAVIAYLHMTDSTLAQDRAPSVVFQQRMDSSGRILPAATPAPRPVETPPAPAGGGPAAAPGGSSLGFVRGGDDLYQEPQPAAAQPQAPRPAPQTVAKAAPPPDPPRPVKAEKKPFMMPHLKTAGGGSRGGGYSSLWKGNESQIKQTAGQVQQAAKNVPDAQPYMQGLQSAAAGNIKGGSQMMSPPNLRGLQGVQGQQAPAPGSGDVNSIMQNMQNQPR